ncbi:MAG: lytic transglycosylase domain-containing protein [bacterium]
MFILLLLGQLAISCEDGEVMLSNIPQVEETNVTKQVVVCDDYDHIIRYYCQEYGIDQQLVKLVIEKESQFNPDAVSKSGAIGLMQLMPETAKILGVEDAYDPWDNVRGGVAYLRDLFDIFDDDLELTLAAYHAGPGIVRELNRVPSIPETVEYVDYIISRYTPAQYRKEVYFTLTDEGTPFITNRPK